jgi:hypothetical protein
MFLLTSMTGQTATVRELLKNDINSAARRYSSVNGGVARVRYVVWEE